MRYFKIIKQSNGATSILVIFMMIVLVTLGAFAIASTNVNVKFSRKVVEWNRMYYNLEGQGEDYLYAIDQKLYRAEQEAIAYITNGNYKKSAVTEVPIEVQKSIRDSYFSGGNMNDMLNDTINKIYMIYAYNALNELSLVYTENLVYSYAEDYTSEVYSENNFTTKPEDAFDANLTVSIKVNPISYGVNFNNYKAIVEKKTDTLRYKIESWKEWQEPVEEHSEDKLWDGSIKQNEEDVTIDAAK